MTNVNRLLYLMYVHLILLLCINNIHAEYSSSFSTTSSTPSGKEHCFHRIPSQTTVQIKYGSLRGEVLEFGHDPTGHISHLPSLEVFLGIPYASPPTGALRFMPPVTPAHWHGVRFADQLAPLCPQKIPLSNLVINNSTEALKRMTLSKFEWLKRMIFRIKNQSEDCLYLNVYTPALSVVSLSQQSKEQHDEQKKKNTIPETNENESAELEIEKEDDEGVLIESEDEQMRNEVHESFFSRKRQSRSRRHRQNLQQQKRSLLSVNNNLSNFSSSSTSSSSPQTSSRRHHERTTANLPVIVFLTGDSFDWSVGSLFDASVLSSFGKVVVITLNYRLGILGFLPANVDETIRGNYGLMDQVAALHWIQENIRQFGGNPGNVTLVGHGHGAAFAHLLMLSPMAKGLFNRVALMSGSALSPWAIARDAPHYANHVGKQLGCSTNDNSQLVECLRSKSISELLSANYSPPDYLSAFGPIVDGIVILAEPRFLLHQIIQKLQHPPESTRTHYSGPVYQQSFPLKSLQITSKQLYSSPLSDNSASVLSTLSGTLTGRHHLPPWSQWPIGHFPIPDLLAGVTSVEAKEDIFSSDEERNGITLARRDRILRTLVRNIFEYHQQTILQTLTNEYTDWTRPLENSINLMDSLTELLGDAEIVSGLVESVDHQNIHNTFYRYQNLQKQQQNKAKSFTKSTFTSGSSGSTNGHPQNFAKIFFYVFSHQNSKNSKDCFHERLGASHGDELPYLFGIPLLSRLISPFHQSSSSCDIVSSSNIFESSEDKDSTANDVSPSSSEQLRHRHHHRRTSLLWSLPTIDISPNHYLFSHSTPISGYRFVNYSDDEVALSKAIITYWVRFASFGNPNDIAKMDEYLDSVTKSSFSSYQHRRRQLLNHESKQTELVHWPFYDITGKNFLNFGSRMTVHDHYHAHRLSVWLSLIPRLHAPVSIADGETLNQARASGKNARNNNNNRNDNNNEDETTDVISTQSEIDGAQLFYLRHHLLPDHENLDTYAGVVKGVEVTLPTAIGKKDWLKLFGRKNMSSIYEQQQRLLYNSYGTLENINRKVMLDNKDPSQAKNGIEQQFLSRRTAASQPSSSVSGSSLSSLSSSSSAIDVAPIFDLTNHQKHENYHISSETKTSKANTERTSVLHYSEAQTVDSYSTALLATIVVGCSLLILNILVFLGVYLQIDRKSSDDEQENNNNNNTENTCISLSYFTSDCNVSVQFDENNTEMYSFEKNFVGNKPQNSVFHCDNFSASGESNYHSNKKFDKNSRTRRFGQNQTLTRPKPIKNISTSMIDHHRKSSSYSSPYCSNYSTTTTQAEVLTSHIHDSPSTRSRISLPHCGSTQSESLPQRTTASELSIGNDDTSGNFQIFTGNDSPSVFYVHYGGESSSQCYLLQSTLTSNDRENSSSNKVQRSHNFITNEQQQQQQHENSNSMLIFGAENTSQYQPVMSFVDGGNFVSFIPASTKTLDNDNRICNVDKNDVNVSSQSRQSTGVSAANLPISSTQSDSGPSGIVSHIDSNHASPYLTLTEISPFSSDQ